MKKLALQVNDEAGLYGTIHQLENGWFLVTLLDLDADIMYRKIRCDDYANAMAHLQAWVWNYEYEAGDPILCQTA